MSYAALVRKYESTGKVIIKGGQCEGRREVTKDKITVDKYTPAVGKGSEYAIKYRNEDDQNYFQMMATATHGVSRLDVTCGPGEHLSQMEQLEELTSIGTIPNLQELNREELTQVYQNYNFDPVEPSEHLETIFNEKEQILKLIENNQVSIIKGPTGCGKSTQIPQFILDSYAERRMHCNIVVTQPRRIAAINIAQRVCKERNWGDVGGIVGYQVGLDRKASSETRLLYCTTGVLLEKLINAKHLNDYTHILLDEVHEREEDMDLTMLIVKKFLRTNSPRVKVVLMSATMDVSRFAIYFEVFLSNSKQPAPTLEIKKEKQFAVQVCYLDELLFLMDFPETIFEKPEISFAKYDVVPLMIKAFNTIDAEDHFRKRCSDKKGAVLIFLPGLYQIEFLYDLLSKEDNKLKEREETKDVLNLWLCPLHSSITKDEQEKVMAFAPDGKRKVILSTNIAESSLTIPDVKYVIDYCLTKHLVADPNTGFTSLQMAWASHTNCIQREGRVGRVQDGRVYRMVPRNFYQFRMVKESTPEIQRCPLDIVVLKCKRLIEDECPLRLISIALDPPDLDNYEKTILKLKEIGALLTTCKGKEDSLDGDLTFMGRVMGSLPLDIRISKLILLGHIFDVLEEAIIMGCAMSVRNIFSEPFQRRLDAYNNKLLWADSSESDAIAYLNAYTVWRSLTGLGKFQRSRGSEQSWGRLYMLQIKNLREVSLQEAEIKKRLKNFNIEAVRSKNKPLWNPMEKPLILKIVLSGAFYPNYFSCNAQNPNAESEAVKMLGGQSPYRCVYFQNMPHPAPLYFDRVKEILHENRISENIKLHYDNSQKLIVEFNQSSKLVTERKIGGKDLSADIPGEIMMPVYRAVKMRQLNTPMVIKIYQPSELKEKLNAHILHSRSSMVSLSGIQSSEFRPAIPLQVQHVEISVTHVEDAGHFYGHIQPTDERLVQLLKMLNASEVLSELSGDVEDNVIYVAPFKEEGIPGNFYYRAKVVNKYQDQNVSCVDVFFIDYGNSVKAMPIRDLREIVNEEIQQEIYKIPPLALDCVLAEVAPNDWKNKGGRWSKEANIFVAKTLISPSKNTWTAKVYSYVNDVASLYLYLEENYRPSDTPPDTLNNVLIRDGFAKYKEESYFSKLNHSKREEIEEKGEYNSSASCTNEEKSSLWSVNRDLQSLPTTFGPSCVNLKGPHSPLEMKLFSKAKCSCQKEVKVEWNSVNSVLLDSDPTDPHERFLVAAFVSQSPDRRKLTLNHTTVLPNMHGLAALICLIFAPSIELRTDEFRSRYTGALCGLGMDNKGVSTFPENDMEIKFDVEFNDEDLINVNKLRYWMNERFCAPDCDNMTDGQIINMQQNIKKLIILLMTRTRRTMKICHNSNPYLWGQVDSRYLRHPFPDSDASQFIGRIYQLHFGIEIDPKNDRPLIEALVKNMKDLDIELKSGLTPRELYCHLCDLDFQYSNLLRIHVSCNHHIEMVTWLNRRAEALGITPTTTSDSSRPSTSRAH